MTRQVAKGRCSLNMECLRLRAFRKFRYAHPNPELDKMKFVQTSLLEIAYEDEGPRDGSPVMLLHGWPDAPRGWNGVAQAIQAVGFRTIVPYLRGLPPTRFLSQATPRFGAAVALARD